AGAQVKETVQDMGTYVQETAQKVGTQVKETVQDVGTQAKETMQAAGTQVYEQGRESLQDLNRTIEGQIRQRPIQAPSWREGLVCCLASSGSGARPMGLERYSHPWVAISRPGM